MRITLQLYRSQYYSVLTLVVREHEMFGGVRSLENMKATIHLRNYEM